MGRRVALLNYRHFWGAPIATPQTQVVPLAAVRDALPEGTPEVSPDTRAAERRARQEHLAWRFRT